MKIKNKEWDLEEKNESDKKRIAGKSPVRSEEI